MKGQAITTAAGVVVLLTGLYLLFGVGAPLSAVGVAMILGGLLWEEAE